MDKFRHLAVRPTDLLPTYGVGDRLTRGELVAAELDCPFLFHKFWVVIGPDEEDDVKRAEGEGNN